MTRKEFEEIKRRQEERFEPDMGAYYDVERLIEALENGGIEDEPDENEGTVECNYCKYGETYWCKSENMQNSFIARYCPACGKDYVKNSDTDEDEPDEPELLPCPFCDAGTSALKHEFIEQLSQGRVCCSEKQGGCGAYSGYGLPSVNKKIVKQRATDKWNTRATMPTEPTKESPSYEQEIVGEWLKRGWENLGEHIGQLISEYIDKKLEVDRILEAQGVWRED